MVLGLPSDYEGRPWAPSPKHQASNKPGTPETTLAKMVLGLTWTASRCCLIFLRMQCRPVETRPTRAKTILGSYTAAQVRSSECEPWPANKFSSLLDAPGFEQLDDVLSTTPLQSASLMADPKLKIQCLFRKLCSIGLGSGG
jgi:hypothetical protein